MAAPLLAASKVPASASRFDPDPSIASDFLTDLRFSARALRKNPVLALTSIFVLALGIGANTVVFSAVNELLLRPLPVDDPESLVDVWADVAGGNSFSGFSYQDFLDYKGSVDAVQEIAAFTGLQTTLGSEEGGPTAIAQLVSPEYFPLLGLRATLGRMAFPQEGRFGDEPLVVLSHRLWTDAFGQDAGIVGRAIQVGGDPATVVGVGPEGFRGHFIGFASDLWMPLTSADRFIPGFDPNDRGSKVFEMIGRLAQGASVGEAREQFGAVARRLEQTYAENEGHGVGITPTTGLDHSLHAGVMAFAAILIAVAGMVLLIACLNVGSVLLVRAMSREQEMAVRLAMGAGNTRLVRQLVTEAVLLVALGATLGVIAAVRINTYLGESLLSAVSGGLALALPLDGRVLAMTVTAALAASVLAGAAPAFHLLKKDPAGALRTRGGGAGPSSRLRTALVVGQVSVSVVLVVATGLFVRTLLDGATTRPGFDPDRVASFTLRPDPQLDEADRASRIRDIVTRVRAERGVASVAVADAPVLGWVRTPRPMDIAGVQPPPGQDRLAVDVRRVGGGYLGTAGLRLREGRDFTDADEQEGPPVAVVSHAFVRRYWPEGNAIGRSFRIGEDDIRVVGVAEDARYIVQDVTPDPLVYLSTAGVPPARAFVTFAAADPAAHEAAIRDIVAANLPGHPSAETMTARQILTDSLFPQRIGAILVGTMGIAALVLAAVGLYGLVQFTVSRDSHELGVRLALGGTGGDLLQVVLRKGLWLVAIGTGVGVVVSALAAPALGSFLPGVNPRDPATYAAVTLVFLGIGFLASYLPARRAARIAPNRVLRGS